MTDQPTPTNSSDPAPGAAPAAAPAGWYADSPTTQRYWDGRQWTEHRAPGQPVAPPSRRNVPALLSLIFGIVGFLLIAGRGYGNVGLLFMIAAFVLSIVGLVRVSRGRTGKGLAIAGIILAGAAFVLYAVYYAIFGSGAIMR